MAYVVDRVVICDAFKEPDKHYQLLPGGKSRLKDGRRSSVRFLASARDTRGGIAGVVGREATLFEDMLIAGEQMNFQTLTRTGKRVDSGSISRPNRAVTQ